MKNEKSIPQPIRGEKGATVKIPRNIERDRQNPDMLVPPETDHGTVENLKFSFSDTHNRLEKGGYAREVTVRELPVSDNIASVNMRLKPGAIRELHWHKEASGLMSSMDQPVLRLLMKKAAALLMMWAKEIYGTSHQACRILFKHWMKAASFC